jgi:hypothetical protein
MKNPTSRSSGKSTHHDKNLPQSMSTEHGNNYIGDVMQPDKPPDTFRVYFQNINGVNKNNWADWEAAAREIKKAKIDVFGCAETNISWTESKRKHAQHIVKQSLKQANLSVANSAEVGTKDYQPGGTANCITG